MQAHRQAAPTRQAALAAVNVALLGIVLYVPTLQTPFVYDDLIEIVGNTSIRDLTQVTRVLREYPSRPLTNLSYAVDFAVGGLNPLVYHVTNVLLHGLNIVLTFWLVRLLVIRARGAEATRSALAIPLLAASLFAVHPVQTEAVTYVSARADVLSASLVLVSLLLFVRAFDVVRGAGVRMALAIFTFLCSLATKEVAVALPVILVGYDWIVLDGDRNERRRRLRQLYLPMFALMLVVGSVRVWRYLVVEQPQSIGIQWQNAMLELHVLQRYVSLMLVPRSLSLVPSVTPYSSIADIRIAIGAATLLACIAVVVLARRRERLAAFGMLWFLVTLIPPALIVVLQNGGHAMAEHRLYLPSIGFFLCVAAVVDRTIMASVVRARTLGMATVALACVVALYATATLGRHRVWRDPVVLWEDAAAKAPGNFTAQYGLAEAYRTAADCPHANMAYQRAMEIRPAMTEPYIGYSWCLLQQGQPAEARAQLELAVQRSPRDVHARVALAVMEANVFGDAARAADICRSAVALAPGDPVATGCARRSALKRGPE